MKQAFINVARIALAYTAATIRKHGPNWATAIVLGVMLAYFAASGF